MKIILAQLKLKIIREKSLSSNNSLASARQVTSNEVNLILKSLNTKKESGTDKILTKLVKLASNFLSEPLATAINSSLAPSKFPDIAKVATIFLLIKRRMTNMIYLTFDL